MLTAAFLALLMMLAVSANRMLVDSSSSYYSSKALEIGTELAQNLIDEATRKSFDDLQNYSYYQSPSELTAPGSLGPSSSELFSLPDVAPYQSPSRYNDVDDYNGYQRLCDASEISGFIVSASVYYVTASDPDSAAGSQTYFKRIDVSVEHPLYLPKVTFSRIVTY